MACQIYTHTRVLRETEIHIARSDDWSVNEPRFIIPLSGARAPPGANCHGENTPALICRSTHHQLLGKLRGYAATRLVHASCFSMSSKVVFPVSGDEISLLVSSVFQRNRLRPIRVKRLKYINRESLIFYSFIFKFDVVCDLFIIVYNEKEFSTVAKFWKGFLYWLYMIRKERRHFNIRILIVKLLKCYWEIRFNFSKPFEDPVYKNHRWFSYT